MTCPAFAPQAEGAPSSTGALDSHAINRADPSALAADLQRILAGPPAQAAITLKAAAEGGVAQAQLVYGQWLLDGRGVACDPGQAVQWFEHASRHGNPMALNMLGQCHAHGWGLPQNVFMAAYWFRLAAIGGLDWGMYNYATALSLGQGVASDRTAALDWFRKAAALGHAKSMNMIGSFYEDGWVVLQDAGRALNWYQQAAAGGDFRGQFNSARLLLTQGRIQAALSWLERVPDTATPAFLQQASTWLHTYLAALPAAPDPGHSPDCAARLMQLAKRYAHHPGTPAPGSTLTTRC